MFSYDASMKESRLLLILAFSLIVAFVVLAFRERFLADPTHADWWSLSFASQQATDGSFTVSDFGTTKTFFYEVRMDDTIAESASFTIGSGSGQTILVQNPDKKPINISVWTESDANKTSKELSKKKEIYKR